MLLASLAVYALVTLGFAWLGVSEILRGAALLAAVNLLLACLCLWMVVRTVRRLTGA
jgi:hypothetical protein